MTRFHHRHVSAIRDRSFDVALYPSLSAGRIDDLVPIIKGRKCFLITTPSVARLYANKIASCLLQSGINLSMLVLP